MRWLRRTVWPGLLIGTVGTAMCPAPAQAAAPAVAAIAPNNGPQAGGTGVTISGSGFGDGDSVSFGGRPATVVTVDSPSSISAASPAGSGTVDVRVAGPGGGSAATPADRFAYDPPPSGPWLGLDGNNSTYLGPVATFAERGVVYDRSGPVDWTAGELARAGGAATAKGTALATDLANGMIPVVAIEYRGYSGSYRPDPAFPSEAHGSRTLGEYVGGFVASAASILAAYPDRGILFEPINEPWGYTTPQFDGAQYAAVIARLMPAARRAGIPLASIYVGATGRRWVSQMYAAEPELRSEIAGWYLHPYGPPRGSSEEAAGGIQSLPLVQAEMTSGQNNIIVSEVGYCALDVLDGQACSHDTFAHGSEAAAALHEMLADALPYHEEGWLRALLVYSRNDGGWAMQLPGGAFTEQGRTLLAFAAAQQPPATPPGLSTAAAAASICTPPLAEAIVSATELYVSDGLSCDPS